VCSRRLLYQSIHSRVAISTSSRPCQGLRRRISSVLNSPFSDSASALSSASPAEPTLGAASASASRWVNRIEVYWYPRAVRARGHFPTELAALTCLYLVTRSLDPSGRGRARWVTRWKPALNAFAITFEGRITPSTTNLPMTPLHHSSDTRLGLRRRFGQSTRGDAGRDPCRRVRAARAYSNGCPHLHRRGPRHRPHASGVEVHHVRSDHRYRGVGSPRVHPLQRPLIDFI
jgi:hypothetical protein